MSFELEFLDERPTIVCTECGADKEREPCHRDCSLTPRHEHAWGPAADWRPSGMEQCRDCGMTRTLLSGFRRTDPRRRCDD